MCKLHSLRVDSNDVSGNAECKLGYSYDFSGSIYCRLVLTSGLSINHFCPLSKHNIHLVGSLELVTQSHQTVKYMTD